LALQRAGDEGLVTVSPRAERGADRRLFVTEVEQSLWKRVECPLVAHAPIQTVDAAVVDPVGEHALAAR
jgi:hypothetical protein